MMSSSYRAQCAGKEAFQTPQLAWRVLLRRPDRREGREAYRCRFCGRFHIGNPMPKPSSKVRFDDDDE